ncbi:MAG: class I SAM-dependent methyltransferase [Nitrososphaerales archaeon]
MTQKDDLIQFISYFYQTKLIINLNVKKILEVGIGNKTASNYLKQRGLNVTTCDIDKRKEPDCVADIRQLPFKDNSFDAIMAYEVLEHLPWDNIDQVLEELKRVTKRYVVISIPYSSHHFEFIFKFPLMRKLIKRDFIDIFFRIPFPVRDIRGEYYHCWEIGRKSYPMQKFRKLLKKKFRIIGEVRPLLHSYHHFFILEKI